MKHLRKFNEELNKIVMGSDINNNNNNLNINIDIPKSMISIAKEFGVTDENMEEVFNNYIQHLLGTIYGQEKNEFIAWCEDSDNISDYISEGKVEKYHKSKDSDVKLEEFRSKLKDFLKSKECKVKQVGDDFEVHVDNKHIAQVMFRKDKMTVKKEGSKFGKDFKFNQLGDMKKELTKIIG